MTDHSMSQSEPSQQSNDNSYKPKRNKKRSNKPRGGAKGQDFEETKEPRQYQEKSRDQPAQKQQP